MTKPYESPGLETVRAWRTKLLEACAKLETFPASELQTGTVTLVSDVAHQMQGVLYDDRLERRVDKIALVVRWLRMANGERADVAHGLADLIESGAYLCAPSAPSQ